MIAHAAFFRTLGTFRDRNPAWHQVLAGLSVLRLVDSFRDNAPLAALTESTTIRTACLEVGAMPEGDPGRGILFRILGLLDQQKELSPEIGRQLLNYGRSLDLEGRWSLAANVFQSIAESFHTPEYNEIVIEASTALGAAARNTGDWNRSDRGYAHAQHLADRSGNRALSLKVRVGVAGSHMVHGNLPAAQEELDDVVFESRAHNLQEVEALAIHAQASLAHSRGDYQRAVHLAYRSLELTTNGSARDRILGDIAAAYAGLGMRDTARDGYSIVAVTSPHQWVRWQATLNLMELAITDGDESLFDDYVGQMQSAELDPRLNAYFLYYQGLGFQRFDRENADELLAEARDYSSQHQLHQLVFEIEEALQSKIPRAEKGPVEPVYQSIEESVELQHIAEALVRIREDAVTGQLYKTEFRELMLDA